MTQLAVISRNTSRDDDDQLASQITLLPGQINAANYRLLKLIAEFDARRAWSGGGMWVIHARLPDEAGSMVVKAIEAVSRPEQEARQQALQEEQANVSAETASMELAKATPGVTPTTCINRWAGEDCDLGMAIEALLRRDSLLYSESPLAFY